MQLNNKCENCTSARTNKNGKQKITITLIITYTTAMLRDQPSEGQFIFKKFKQIHIAQKKSKKKNEIRKNQRKKIKKEN